MHRQSFLFVSLLFIIAMVIVAAGYVTGAGPLGLLSNGISRLTSGGQMIPPRTLTEETKAPAAPELASGTWINSEPLTLKNLHGRVVLIEFWTFACYNCRNTVPTVTKWDAQYRDKGLTIIGVHTPETDLENNINDVRREVAALGIKYPVVTDNDYLTWNAYQVEAWPTLFLLDKQGRVRWTHVGEGYYDEAEEVIKKLLAEQAPAQTSQTDIDRTTKAALHLLLSKESAKPKSFWTSSLMFGSDSMTLSS
jgi:thiol-disulfide isomerase/thioredoxin